MSQSLFRFLTSWNTRMHASLRCKLCKNNRAFEVIVVDDCSTDGTPEVIAQIRGVVYLRNDSNSGFIASCNAGAKTARGKYLRLPE